MSINTNQQLLDAIRNKVIPIPRLSLIAKAPPDTEARGYRRVSSDAPDDWLIGDDENTILTGNTDLLAASCALWRTSLGNGSLLDGEYTSIAQDIEKAEKIRSYYKNKLVFAKLRDGSLSEYRTDLYTFLNTDGTTFPKKMIGIAYYLPPFFDYDMSLENILASPLLKRDLLDSTPDLQRWRTRPASNVCDLINMVRLGTTHRVMKSKNCKEYWMTNHTGTLFLISIDNNNPLRFMWEEVYDQDGPLAFQAVLAAGRANGTNRCYELKSWKFIGNA